MFAANLAAMPTRLPAVYLGASGAEGSSFSFPTSQSGDLIVAFVNFCLSGASTPSGWTLAMPTYYSTSHGYTYGVYYRVRGADTSVSFPTTYGGCNMVAYRGATSVTANSGWGEAYSGTFFTIPSITPTSASGTLIAYVSDRDAGYYVYPTSPFVTRNQTGFTYFSNLVADRVSGSTAATGATNWTVQSGLGNVGTIVEIV